MLSFAPKLARFFSFPESLLAQTGRVVPPSLEPFIDRHYDFRTTGAPGATGRCGRWVIPAPWQRDPASPRLLTHLCLLNQQLCRCNLAPMGAVVGFGAGASLSSPAGVADWLRGAGALPAAPALCRR